MTRRALPLLLLLASCGVDKRQADDMGARIDALEKKVEALEKAPASGRPTTQAVADSPDEKAATDLMQAVQQAQQANDYETAKTKLAELLAKYPNTRAGRASQRLSTELNLIGADAKPIEVEKWYQGQASLTDAPVTVVVFWESWCPHCKDEMPKMEPFAEKWKAKGVQVVGLTKVTKSATDDTVTKFISDNSIKFPIGKEKEGSMSQAYSVSGIPAAAIVKGGKVVWRGHPARLTDDMMTKFTSAG